MTPASFAQLPPGQDSYVFPPGGKAGTTIEVRLGGADWTPDIQFFVHDPRVKLEVLSKPSVVLLHEPPYWFGIKSFANDPRLPREVSARFVLPANMLPGPIHWSVANANGGGSGGVFMVGTANEVTEDESRRGPQELPSLPVTVNGRLRRIEEVDRYRFWATRSGPVTCELTARRLGSDFLGVIEICDIDGSKVAEAVDTEGRDPTLTFAVEKGKPYTVCVRDVDHRGYRCFTYRLTLTPGPRVITTIPAAGRRGDKRPVEFVGIGIATGQARLESVTKEVAFPNDPDRESFTYRLETPYGIAPAIPLLLSDDPEQLEPTTTDPKERRFTVPGAVTGRIGRRGERDTYTLVGKKGDAWDVAVQALQIGSPLNVTLTIIGPDGKQLVAKDDLDGSSQVRVPFTLPSDGDYRIIVGDVSGKRPGADAVYRLVAKRPPTRFRVRTGGIVNVPIGGKAALTVGIVREGGFKEPVFLSFTGLPAGVTVPKELVIPPTADTFPISLECSKDAPASASLVQIVGTAKVGQRTVTQAVCGDFQGDLAPRRAEANLVPRVLIATTMKPPFKVRAAEADGGRRIPRGSTHLAEILIERTDGFTGEVILDMAGNQQRHRQGIRGPAFSVAPGQTKVDYPVFVPEWLETTRTSRMGLIAMAQVPDAKGRPRHVLTAMEGQITMSIEGALMKLSHGPEEITAPVGKPFDIRLKLARSPQLPEAVTVELIVPEDLKGLVTAKPLAWPMDEAAATWPIDTQDNSRLIGIWQLTARATALRGGHPVVSETTFEVEFVSGAPNSPPPSERHRMNANNRTARGREGVGHRHLLGVTRRELLQVGYSGLLGLGLPSLLARRTEAAEGERRSAAKPPRSVILIFLTGAPSHLDMFDLKPDAPAEVRGEFRPIASRTVGLQICEHLPQLASRSDKFAIVRSMTHGLPSHEHATHMVLTGIDKMPPGSTHMASRHDWPSYASGLDFVRPRRDGIPNGVMHPTYLNNGYGFSGQHAGFLGAKHDPWHVKQDPNAAEFRVENLSLPVGLSVSDLDNRMRLLAQVDRQRAALAATQALGEFGDLQHQAFSVLTASRVSRAFAIDREPDRVRQRYGRHLFGQSLLLTRRLIEAGLPIVQANMGSMNNWDTHNSNFKQLKDRLLPPLDQGVAALLDDLETRGLLDETLVVMVGEFGRTPKLGGNVGTPSFVPDGRDHWAGVFFALFAGAGVRGGQLIGRSDKIAAYPAVSPYYPSNLGATIYQTLGVDPRTAITDPLNRPMHLNEGEPIAPLFTGATS